MFDVSPAEIKRQIEREGRRHGLYPVIQNGRCFVGQKERSYNHGALLTTVAEEVTVICSVTMQHPLSNVWKSRKQREDFNNAAVYREAASRRRAAELVAMNERYQDRIRELKRLERIYGSDEISAAYHEAQARGLIKMGRT
jgi:hypothetical protein